MSVGSRTTPRVILTGERYERWTVVEDRTTGRIKARCDCGTERELSIQVWARRSKSCGCYQQKHPERVIPAGTRHGRLTVTTERRATEPIRCRCDCGKDRIVTIGNWGRTISCGCVKAGTGNGRYSHGKSRTKIYRIWADMVGRCSRPTHMRYADYGGRGISVCERWMSFPNFYSDMGDRPENLSLDRVNNDGNYEPSNCRWATAIEQRNNRRPMRNRGVN